MSYRINTNVLALNALTNLGQVGDQFSQSVNRLSTGLRINSGADDPAGLIISEEFRAQISGINQAIRNNQDVVNYAKTAEGALSEVNSLLLDARGLAVGSANSGALDAAAIQANQSQLNSIIASITRISTQTEFGNKKILDGSAGVNATLVDGADFSALSFTGQFSGKAITANSGVTIAVTAAATEASLASKTFSFGTTTLTAGSFSLNGTTFNVTSSDTVDTIVQKINASQGQTGVTAAYTVGGAITFTQTNYGSGSSINLSDANGVLLAAAGSASASGTDATANAVITTASGLVTVPFTGGKYGANGLQLSDADGNKFTLTENGNKVASNLAGQLAVGSAQFQIGANANESVNLSLGNFAASQLGQGAVAGLNMGNLDLTTPTGATNALKVIDAAIQQVSVERGNIGSFQRNIVQSNIRSLSVAKTSLTATESSIRDVDVAEEMTNFTKLQILQQSGLSVLAQANAGPQAVLKLLG
jgi:flagellin